MYSGSLRTQSWTYTVEIRTFELQLLDNRLPERNVKKVHYKSIVIIDV